MYTCSPEVNQTLTFQLAVIHTNRIIGDMCTQKYFNSWICCSTRTDEPFHSQPSQKSSCCPSGRHFLMMRYWNSFVSPYFILSCSCYHIWQGNVDIFSRILLHSRLIVADVNTCWTWTEGLRTLQTLWAKHLERGVSVKWGTDSTINIPSVWF